MEEKDLFDLNDYDELTESYAIKEKEALQENNIEQKQFIKPDILIENINDYFRLENLNETIPALNDFPTKDQLRNNTINDYQYDLNKKFACEDDIDIGEFKKKTQNTIKYPFELDDFQKRSIIRLEQHKNVLVCAHTSSGKTVIAEYGISLGKNNKRRVLYTSPIKALSNQKYREFKKKFGDVGILTGDVSINPDAQCLIMTTEILQNSLYKSSELLNAVEWVVFDEIHYINDNERGHVWEEILILLPPQIGIIMLSATIPNYMEFAQWVGRIKNTTIYVQNTLKRIVPLEHKLYIDSSSILLVKDANNKVYDEQIEEALKLVHGKRPQKKLKQLEEKIEYEESKVSISYKDNRKCNRSDFNKKTNMLSKIEEIVEYLYLNHLTPGVIFIFSIRQITEYGKMLTKIQLVDKSESNKINSFFETCIGTLSQEDKAIPQIQEIKEMLLSGIAIHHSGLLPILKEIIEILYSKGLIKILLATTSFSIGLNMPTRTVVFTDIYKYNDEKRQILSSSEYLQMCGRAGRRGIDIIGNVFLIFTEKNTYKEKNEIIGMLNGTGTSVESKFRLSYKTIISFFSRNIKNIQDFFKESFLESINIEQLPSLMKEINDLKKEIKAKEKINCYLQLDNSLIENYISIDMNIRKINTKLMNWNPIANKLKIQGRFIKIRDPEYMTDLIVLLINFYTQYNNEVWCLRLVKNSKIQYEENERNNYNKGFYKGYNYAYVDYRIEDIVDIYEDKIDIRIQVTDEDNYQYPGKADLLLSLDRLIEYNYTNRKNPILTNYEKLAYNEKKILALISKKNDLRNQLKKNKCYECKFLKEHYIAYTKLDNLKMKLNEKVQLINPENMAHYQEFTLRLRILQKFDYIDDNQMLTLKGKAAREIATTDCLLVGNILLSNVLEKLPDEEIIAFLSCFASNKHELDYKDPKISDTFSVAFREFDYIYKNIINIEQEDNGFEDNKYNRKISFLASQAMNSWMIGKSFSEIVNETDLEEGKLYNLIMRIYLFIEEIINFYKTMEYTALIAKFKRLKQKMIRDIMAIQSLYLQESFNIDID